MSDEPACHSSLIPHPFFEVGRQESNLLSTAYQTLASPLGFGPLASALDGTRTRLACSTNRSPHPLRPRAKKSVRRESHPPIHLGKMVPDAARPRTRSARTEGVEPSVPVLEAGCSPRSTS